MQPEQVINWLTQGGAVAALVIIIWTGVKGQWVFGWVHREALAARDAEIARLRNEVKEWQEVGMRASGLLDQGTAIADRAVAAAQASRLPAPRRPRLPPT